MQLNLALIGYGGVNQGLVDVLRQKQARLQRQHDLTLNIVAVTDLRGGLVWNRGGLDLAALAAVPGNGFSFRELAGSDGGYHPELTLERTLELLAADFIDVVVEATFTDPASGEPALTHCKAALAHGKHVVTTNKGPIALALSTLQQLAESGRARLKYEGAVMSGTPVLRQLSTTLRGCDFNGFAGILNGTSNFVLGQVEQGRSMAEAIREAQRLGYAEANPAADIEGHDVQLKVTILANALWDARLQPGDVPCKGITCLSEDDIRAARAEGGAWKLIGQARRQADGRLAASVAPQRLPAGHPLLAATGATNAIAFDTDLLGQVTISGPGAGRTETAFAILSDLIELADELAIPHKE